MSSPSKEPRFRIVHRESRPDLGLSTEVVDVSGVRFAEGVKLIAGPCAVESGEQAIGAAKAAKAAGAHMLRGGIFKTRTSPYDFQGIGLEGLKILEEARRITGLPFVTEVLEPAMVGPVAASADMLQVGTRNMHNTPLLRELGRCGKPVLLKRGWASTLNEWLCAAEYVALGGNTRIVLCERGVRRDLDGDHFRPDLDLAVIARVRKLTYLPVIVDPSHGTENAASVPMACSKAIAAGADGLIIEVLPSGWTVDMVKCDGHQSVTPGVLEEIARAATA